MGVPIPPRFAPIGIAIVRAMRPLPLAGNERKTGVRKVSIIAAVAVLLINIEKMPVIRINPKSTFSLFFPNGLIKFLARRTSSPDLVAAIAKIKPPKKRIIVGSAKHAMIP